MRSIRIWSPIKKKASTALREQQSIKSKTEQVINPKRKKDEINREQSKTINSKKQFRVNIE